FVRVLFDSTFLVLPYSPGTPYLAGRDGHVTRQIGREGAGPGEFRGPQLVLMWDTAAFYVGDQPLRRLTRLSKPEFEYQATVPVPRSFGGTEPVMFSDESYILHSAGELHWVSNRGDVLASFGGAQPGSRAEAGAYVTALAASGDSAVWVGYRDLYLIELWRR